MTVKECYESMGSDYEGVIGSAYTKGSLPESGL